MTETSEKKPRKERKQNADMRRRQLLDAARRSILKHGLSRTTLATVAAEAGLSQGVAVFYFKSKGGLLVETLRDLYRSYEAHWHDALARTGSDPMSRLVAILDADFDEAACGADVLPLWFAFWGELHFQAQYEEVAETFDARRKAAMTDIWRDLLPDQSEAQTAQYADWMETVTDGFWQRLHLAPGSIDRGMARAATLALITRILPSKSDSRG